MGKLVDVKAAVKKTEEEIYWTESQRASVRAFLRSLPTVDAVEVIRCGECKHYGTNGCVMDTYLVDVTEGCFCSYGERRSDEKKNNSHVP